MTDEPHQSAVGEFIAQADRGSTAIVNNITGFKSEEVASLMQVALQAAGAAQQTRIDELAALLNTNREAVLGFFKILQEEDVPVEQLQPKLTLIAQRHVGMLERLAALDPEDTEAQGYIDEAREVLRQAASTTDYDRADALLSQAEEAQDRCLRRAEALEREAHEAASRMRHSQAATQIEDLWERHGPDRTFGSQARRFSGRGDLSETHNLHFQVHHGSVQTDYSRLALPPSRRWVWIRAGSGMRMQRRG